MTTEIRRLIDLILIGAIAAIPLFIWYNDNPATALLNIFLAPLLFLYYYHNRQRPLEKIDWCVFGILVSILATDIANINAQINNSLISYSLIFVIIYQAGYIYFMRHEKVRVTFNGFIDIVKIIIPSFVFFSIFGYFFLDHPSNFEYLLILISDIETTLLVILALFRTKTSWSYYSFAIGAGLLGITNILYLLLQINYLSETKIDLMICCYWFSHFFLLHSILKSVNMQELTAERR